MTHKYNPDETSDRLRYRTVPSCECGTPEIDEEEGSITVPDGWPVEYEEPNLPDSKILNENER